MGGLNVEDFAPDDRVRVNGYDSPGAKIKIDGEEGSVVAMDTAGTYVPVKLDTNLAPVKVWLFLPRELVRI